ncbi:hypothetical protein AURDEDRAFT_121725 [Auricularia subglabra TFB-10046 SS5]|nr:hypothetical protein AURDEDRAFT_121725 [Auricularia subglabra TFB-10046 SS5]
MAQALPLDVIAAVLEYCSPADLVAASMVSSAVQLEAEHILYRHIVVKKMDVLKKLLLSIDARRGEIVRRFDILSWADPDSQGLLDAHEREYALISQRVSVGRLLRRMTSLQYFTNDWLGEQGCLLIALPACLRGLHVACDLDRGAVSALRHLKSLTSLRMKNFGQIDGRMGVHLCRAGFWADQSLLPALERVQGPHCCLFRLLHGRNVRRLELSNTLLPTEIDDLAVADTVCASLTAAKILVLSEGDRVLQHMRRFRALVYLELIEPGLKPTPNPKPVDKPWATADSIGAAIRGFPTLQDFRLTTAFDPDFDPEEMNEDSRRNLVLRWANGSSPCLDHIYVAKLRRRGKRILALGSLHSHEEVDLVVASTLSREIQLEAERIIYRHIVVKTQKALAGVLTGLIGAPRRGGIVRRFDLCSWGDQDLQRALETNGPSYLSGVKKAVGELGLSQMPYLRYFSSDWGGGAESLLGALPTGLRGLQLAFDLDADMVPALRKLTNLTNLSITETSPEPPRAHLCDATVAADASFLPALEGIRAPHCCAMALLPGRKIRRLHVQVLSPSQVDDLGDATPTTSLEEVAIVVFSHGDRALEHMQRFRGLEEVFIAELGITSVEGGVLPFTDAPWATVDSIGAAICAFPVLRAFRLAAVFDPDFRPEEMDEDARRQLIVCWAEGASPRLDLIELTKSEFDMKTRTGFSWRMEWCRKNGAWLQF